MADGGSICLAGHLMTLLAAKVCMYYIIRLPEMLYI